MGRTLYDKIWDEHVVHAEEDGTSILYIDRHLVHEVTSPQAFERLGTGDFVDQVAVDVEDGRAVFLGVDDVFVPDLVVERFAHGYFL